jgi:hypothetical protein
MVKLFSERAKTNVCGYENRNTNIIDAWASYRVTQTQPNNGWDQAEDVGRERSERTSSVGIFLIQVVPGVDTYTGLRDFMREGQGVRHERRAFHQRGRFSCCCCSFGNLSVPLFVRRWLWSLRIEGD